jgi:SAM-dependent methyltransferase
VKSVACYRTIQGALPGFLRRYVLDFETRIESAVADFAGSLPPGSRVLDAGAGEGAYRKFFRQHRYCGVDLAIGDLSWDYGGLDVLADLVHLPFPDSCLDACLSIVTLEHVREPAAVLRETARALKAGGALLLVVPQEWEVHQAPHDYFRYTRHGIEYLLEEAGFADIQIRPAGGLFRLLSRRLLNALQFFRGVWFFAAAFLLVPPALLLPTFDSLDHQRTFTLGYLCTARKRF